jgi:hypothetical protein
MQMLYAQCMYDDDETSKAWRAHAALPSRAQQRGPGDGVCAWLRVAPAAYPTALLQRTQRRLRSGAPTLYLCALCI